LEREIYEQPPARLRIYGYLSDKEFCEECAKRNVTVYGALWKAHLWEFPAEFNDDETELLSLNITRGVGKKGWVGIRELSQDRYPALFSSMKSFSRWTANQRGRRNHRLPRGFKERNAGGSGHLFPLAYGSRS
jgi:hypothetical protein